MRMSSGLPMAVILAGACFIFIAHTDGGDQKAKGDALQALVDAYRADACRSLPQSQWKECWRTWFDRFTEAIKGVADCDARRSAQFVRVSLANGLDRFATSRDICLEEAGRPYPLSGHIMWLFDAASAAEYLFYTSQQPEDGKEALALYSRAKREFTLHINDPYVINSDLDIMFVANGDSHARLAEKVGAGPIEAGQILLESERVWRENLTGEKRRSLQYPNAPIDGEFLLSKAMLAFARGQALSEAWEAFRRLEAEAALRRPLARYFLDLALTAYPNGGVQLHNRVNDWLRNHGHDPLRGEVMLDVGRHQFRQGYAGLAAPVLERIVAEFESATESDAVARRYVIDASYELRSVCERNGKQEEARRHMDRFAKLAAPEDPRRATIKDQ